MNLNKYGLSRVIDASTKRQVRQECGYGCVVCGNAIFQYEHIDPKFSEARKHDPKSIALLCGTCHDQVTRGVWSKEKIIKARLRPYCKQEGYSKFMLDVCPGNDFLTKIGNTTFESMQTIIEIDDRNILSVFPPEEPNTPPRITAAFYDRNNKWIASIEKNEWNGSADAFDIETIGSQIIIRSAQKRIDLNIDLKPPNLLHIRKIELRYNDAQISGSSASGFRLENQISSLTIPDDDKTLKHAPFWISIKDNRINLGSDNVITFIHGDGKAEQIAGHYSIHNADVKLVDRSSFDEPPPIEMPSSQAFIITSGDDWGSLRLNFAIPEQKRRKAQISLRRLDSKIGRNDPCACQSGKKYKRCCQRNWAFLEEILTSEQMRPLINEVSKVFGSKEIAFQFRHNFNATVDYDPSLEKPCVLMNSSISVVPENIAFALTSVVLVQQGFPTTAKGLFADKRQVIVQALNRSILLVPVIKMMMEKGFNIEAYFRPSLLSIDESLSKRELEDVSRISIGRVHYEAVIYLGVKHVTDFVPEIGMERFRILFERKAPVSKIIGEEMIEVIKGFDPCQPEGNALCLYDCLSLINDKDLIDEVPDSLIDLYRPCLDFIKIRYSLN